MVELDGRAGHEGTGAFRDMVRDNYAVVIGQATLRYGWLDVVDRSCPTAFQVAEVLIDRGWTGVPHRCPRCLNVTDFEIG